MVSTGRTGRRPGNPDTRGDIVNAARELFTTRGYNATSIRAIARHAHVDPALVHRWFNSKQRLFMAVLAVDFNPVPVIREAFDGNRRDLGKRLARTVVTYWTSSTGVIAAESLRETPHLIPSLMMYLNEPLYDLVHNMGVTHAEAKARVAILEAIIVGFATTRMVTQLEPIASMPAGDLADVLAPLLQHALTGPISAAALTHHHLTTK